MKALKLTTAISSAVVIAGIGFSAPVVAEEMTKGDDLRPVEALETDRETRVQTEMQASQEADLSPVERLETDRETRTMTDAEAATGDGYSAADQTAAAGDVPEADSDLEDNRVTQETAEALQDTDRSAVERGENLRPVEQLDSGREKHTPGEDIGEAASPNVAERYEEMTSEERLQSGREVHTPNVIQPAREAGQEAADMATDRELRGGEDAGQLSDQLSD